MGIKLTITAAIVAIGLAVGLAARHFNRGRAPEVFLTSTMLGVSGALSATLLGLVFDWHDGGMSSLIWAAIGAAILVMAHHFAGDKLGP